MRCCPSATERARRPRGRSRGPARGTDGDALRGRRPLPARDVHDAYDARDAGSHTDNARGRCSVSWRWLTEATHDPLDPISCLRNCWYGGPCSANYIDIPVDLQWNFYLARRFSAFAELGLDIYHGFYGDCPNGPTCPGHPPGGGVGIEPDIYIGGRFYLDRSVALTLRLGFPAVSFGTSFLP